MSNDIYGRGVDQSFTLLFLGFVSNGEHNSLCIKGQTRPLHIFQIRSDVRAKMSRTSSADDSIKGYVKYGTVYVCVHMCECVHVFVCLIMQLVCVHVCT